jgi:pectate lyase
VWVSPYGNDSNSGLTSDDAFLTINRALEIIYPTDDNPITIHLLEGTYAPSTTGEVYSIIMISNVTLIGEGPDVTILNAEQSGRVITMNDVYNVTISRLTLTGGYAQGDHHTTDLLAYKPPPSPVV